MDKKQGLMLVFLTSVISGFSIFFNKYSVGEIESSVFTFLKNLVVALLLCGLLFFTKEIQALRNLNKKQWSKLVLIGFLGGSIPFLLFFKGLSMTSAAAGSFFHKTLFIYAAIFAVIFLREKINKKIILVSILLLAGNFLLLKLKTLSFGTGDMLIIIAAIFWAVESVVSKHALKELSGNVVAFGRMIFGSIFIFLYIIFAGKLATLTSLSGQQILWTLATSVLLLLYVITFYNGLKQIKVSTATSILLLGSPITTALSLLFSNAPVTLMQAAGIILILAGVISGVYFIELAKGKKSIISQQRNHSV